DTSFRPFVYSPQEQYEWVSAEVRKYESIIPPTNVKTLVKSRGWVEPQFRSSFKLAYCSPDERVCLAAKERDSNFIYMYETLFRDLGVTIPFDYFAIGVLQLLELHPNGGQPYRLFALFSAPYPLRQLPHSSSATTPLELVPSSAGYPSP
ncbi:hypothetical protein CR513_01953, partial [Mucuna pruriens]